METVWNLFGWLKKTFRPRRNRKGSSLAFVMAIGIALVQGLADVLSLGLALPILKKLQRKIDAAEKAGRESHV